MRKRVTIIIIIIVILIIGLMGWRLVSENDSESTDTNTIIESANDNENDNTENENATPQDTTHTDDTQEVSTNENAPMLMDQPVGDGEDGTKATDTQVATERCQTLVHVLTSCVNDDDAPDQSLLDGVISPKGDLRERHAITETYQLRYPDIANIHDLVSGYRLVTRASSLYPTLKAREITSDIKVVNSANGDGYSDWVAIYTCKDTVKAEYSPTGQEQQKDVSVYLYASFDTNGIIVGANEVDTDL